MFDDRLLNIGYLDTLSCRDTVIHRLDPRVKLTATLLFILTVVSFPKYEVTGLLPFFLFPVLFFSLGDIPVKFIVQKVLFVSPFALFIGIFNPMLDSRTAYSLWGFPVSGGWVSFLSIMLKFLLTTTSALLLVATTSFPGVCHALQKLGMPELFVSQLLFLYRYIFVLTEEALRMVRARDMRSFGKRGGGMRAYISLVGTFFLRSIERAERIYQAMLSRGFTGRLHAARPYRFSYSDAAFAATTGAAFYILRTQDVVGALGEFFMGMF